MSDRSAPGRASVTCAWFRSKRRESGPRRVGAHRRGAPLEAQDVFDKLGGRL